MRKERKKGKIIEKKKRNREKNRDREEDREDTQMLPFFRLSNPALASS
jgi:hypothetical protein